MAGITAEGLAMANGGKGRWIFIVAGVILLVSAAILWWRVIRDGSSTEGALTPVFFTLLGVFWLLYAWKAKQPSKTSGGD
jgi:drug/metabolite transporter (DMT)-like permease